MKEENFHMDEIEARFYQNHLMVHTFVELSETFGEDYEAILFGLMSFIMDEDHKFMDALEITDEMLPD